MPQKGTIVAAAHLRLSLTRALSVKSSRAGTWDPPSVSRIKGRKPDRGTHTTLPLVVVTKRIMRVIVQRADWLRLTLLEEVGSSSNRSRDTHQNAIRCAVLSETVTLTRPRFRVITSTKWEVNMTRKYRVASSTMVPRMPETFDPPMFDFFAKKTISKKARVSGRGHCRHGQNKSVGKKSHAP
jgi:hypothetical protein